MARADKSIFDAMQETAPVETAAVNPEIAATVLQQQMMEKAGELQPVHFVGPQGKLINGYYSPEQRAFLPKFKVV